MFGIAGAHHDTQIGVAGADAAHQQIQHAHVVDGKHHSAGMIELEPIEQFGAAGVAIDHPFAAAAQALHLVRVAVHRQPGLAVHVQHLCHQPANAAITDDHGLPVGRFWRRLLQVFVALGLQPCAGQPEQRRQRQSERGYRQCILCFDAADEPR